MNPTAKLKNPPDNSRMTPIEIVKAAQLCLETIDLDPASDAEANARINARYFYTEAQDGLLHSWYGNVFLNPPGGKLELPGYTKPVSKVAVWWAKLLHEVRSGHTKEAIFVVFNLEALLNTQKFDRHPVQAFPYCVPRKRLKYQSRNGGKTGSPGGASAIVYVGDRPDEFHKQFSKFGYVTKGLKASQIW